MLPKRRSLRKIVEEKAESQSPDAPVLACGGAPLAARSVDARGGRQRAGQAALAGGTLVYLRRSLPCAAARAARDEARGAGRRAERESCACDVRIGTRVQESRIAARWPERGEWGSG